MPNLGETICHERLMPQGFPGPTSPAGRHRLVPRAHGAGRRGWWPGWWSRTPSQPPCCIPPGWMGQAAAPGERRWCFSWGGDPLLACRDTARGSSLLHLESKTAIGRHQILMLSIYEALRAGLWPAEGEADALRLSQGRADDRCQRWEQKWGPPWCPCPHPMGCEPGMTSVLALADGWPLGLV